MNQNLKLFLAICFAVLLATLASPSIEEPFANCTDNSAKIGSKMMESSGKWINVASINLKSNKDRKFVTLQVYPKVASTMSGTLDGRYTVSLDIKSPYTPETPPELYWKHHYGSRDIFTDAVVVVKNMGTARVVNQTFQLWLKMGRDGVNNVPVEWSSVGTTSEDSLLNGSVTPEASVPTKAKDIIVPIKSIFTNTPLCSLNPPSTASVSSTGRLVMMKDQNRWEMEIDDNNNLCFNKKNRDNTYKRYCIKGDVPIGERSIFDVASD